MPSHLVAHATPRQSPQAHRHGRKPSHGPRVPSSGAVNAAASLRLPSSRSSRRQPKAASTQNIRKMSSIEVRLCTNSSPSKASSTAAMQPRTVDRKSRRAIRAMSRIERLPMLPFSTNSLASRTSLFTWMDRASPLMKLSST